MFWLIAWIALTGVMWMMDSGDRGEAGDPPRSAVVSVLIASGYSLLILIAIAVLLSNPGLWNALSMGQR